MGLSLPTETPPDRRRGGQSFGIPSWAGDESISRNPTGVPVLDSFTAHGAFKAADLACLCNVLAAVINRAALTSSMGTDPRVARVAVRLLVFLNSRLCKVRCRFRSVR